MNRRQKLQELQFESNSEVAVQKKQHITYQKLFNKKTKNQGFMKPYEKQPLV